MTSETVSVDQLKRCKISFGLDESQIERVASSCSVQKLSAGETLVESGGARFAVYTVLRGRLKMYHRFGGESERFIGYVNQGESAGQSSFLSEQFDEGLKIEADIESTVAVINRERTLRLVFGITQFRKNLIAAFSERATRLFRGEQTRRFLKIVGFVSSSDRTRQFLPQLCTELADWENDFTILTDRSEAFPDYLQTKRLSGDGKRTPFELRKKIQHAIGKTKRVLIDIVFPETIEDSTEVIEAAKECEEVLWCCDNENPQGNHENLLGQLVNQHPDWRSRLVCVQILSRDATVGRKKSCCPLLKQRDFLVPLRDSPSNPKRLYQQGMDRIIRHLRGVKIGLALGGGGARGMSHLGVLRVLDDSQINFDLMSGTSVGAMVGLGYAAGLSPDYLVRAYANELQPSGLLDRLPGGRRLFLFSKFQTRGWEKMLRKHYHDWTFEQLPIPFSVVVTDLVSGEEVIRESGDIVDAILESINVPILAKPLLRPGRMLVDGGVLNNLPAELLSDQGAEYVLGVDASKEIANHFAGNFPNTPADKMKKPNRFETAQRVMDVSRRGIAKLQMSFADHAIEPDTSAFDFADFTAANAISKTGEAAAIKMLPEIQAALNEILKS